MTREEIADLLRRYEQAIGQHDATVQAGFYAPEGVREGPAFGAVKRQIRGELIERLSALV